MVSTHAHHPGRRRCGRYRVELLLFCGIGNMLNNNRTCLADEVNIHPLVKLTGIFSVFFFTLFLFSFSSFFWSGCVGAGGWLSVQYISVLNSLQSGKATREEEEARVVEQKGEGRRGGGKREKRYLSSSGLTPRRNQPRGDAHGPGQTS